MLLQDKGKELQRILMGYGKIGIAFSGGADSSLLLRYAIDTLGAESIVVLTSRSPLLSKLEIKGIETWFDRQLVQEKIRHAFVDIDPLSWPEFVSNPEDRCYHCKNKVYRMFLEKAGAYGMQKLVDGTNADDVNSTRPGLRALRELDIGIPLADAGLNKDEVRLLSRSHGLHTWNKPSASCLATRIPAGLEITEDRIQLVEKCESELEKLGFAGCRFRLHRYNDDTASIQVQKEDLHRITERKTAGHLRQIFSNFGMKKIFIDRKCR